MDARRRLLVIPLAVAALLLGGCASPAAEPTRTAAATQSGPDGPALREALAEIDPALDDEQSLAAAQEVCLDIQEGKSDEEVAETARDQFSGIPEGELTDEDVAEIVEAVKTHFCR